MMGDDGDSADITISAIGITRAAGQALLGALQAAALSAAQAGTSSGANPDAPTDTAAAADSAAALLVSLDGAEVALATADTARTDGVPHAWATRPASQVRICRAHEAPAPLSTGKLVVSAQGHVQFGTGSDADEPAQPQQGCLPGERTLPIRANAFDATEWEELRALDPTCK